MEKLEILKKIKLSHIFLFALFLRIFFVLLLPPSNLGAWDADSSAYITLAHTLAESGTYGYRPQEPSAFYPPLFVYFLAAFLKFGFSEQVFYILVRCFQAVFGAIVCAAIYRIAREISRVHITPCISAVLCAVHPALIAHTGTLMTESFYTFLLVISMVLIIRVQKAPGFGKAVAAGICFGLTGLTREPICGFIPLAAVFLIFTVPRTLPRWVVPVGLILGCGMILAPWTVRNFVRFHRFIPVSERGTEYLYVAQHIPAAGEWIPHGDFIEEQLIEARRKKDPEVSWTLMAFREFKGNISRKPFKYTRMLWVKLREFWGHPSGLYQLKRWPVVYWSYLGFHLILMGFFLIGTFFCLRERAFPAIYPFLLLVYTTFFHVVVVWPLARYFVPMLAFVCLFAGLGIRGVIRFAQQKSA